MFTDAKLVDDAGTTFGSSVNPMFVQTSLNGLTVTRGTGTATMQYIFDPENDFSLEYITCRFATTETPVCTFTVTASSAGGAAYSAVLLFSEAAANTNSHMFFPTRAIPFVSGDTLYLECSTASDHVWAFQIYTFE